MIYTSDMVKKRAQQALNLYRGQQKMCYNTARSSAAADQLQIKIIDDPNQSSRIQISDIITPGTTIQTVKSAFSDDK